MTDGASGLLGAPLSASRALWPDTRVGGRAGGGRAGGQASKLARRQNAWGSTRLRNEAEVEERGRVAGDEEALVLEVLAGALVGPILATWLVRTDEARLAVQAVLRDRDAYVAWHGDLRAAAPCPLWRHLRISSTARPKLQRQF